MALLDAFGEGEFSLPIPLTEDEINDRKSEYFITSRKLDEENRKLDNAKVLHKVQSEPLKKQIGRLYTEINEGVVQRTVVATEVPDEDEGVINYCDVNTGEVIYSRAMTPSEKQQYRIKFGRRLNIVRD